MDYSILFSYLASLVLMDCHPSDIDYYILTFNSSLLVYYLIIVYSIVSKQREDKQPSSRLLSHVLS